MWMLLPLNYLQRVIYKQLGTLRKSKVWKVGRNWQREDNEEDWYDYWICLPFQEEVCTCHRTYTWEFQNKPWFSAFWRTTIIFFFLKEWNDIHSYLSCLIKLLFPILFICFFEQTHLFSFNVHQLTQFSLKSHMKAIMSEIRMIHQRQGCASFFRIINQGRLRVIGF